MNIVLFSQAWSDSVITFKNFVNSRMFSIVRTEVFPNINLKFHYYTVQ